MGAGTCPFGNVPFEWIITARSASTPRGVVGVMMDPLFVLLMIVVVLLIVVAVRR